MSAVSPRRAAPRAVVEATTAVRARTPSQVVESALVDAAERVLVRDGLDGLTVRAVAAEAGVAPMGVYSRFGSKDGLVQAVVIRAFDLLREHKGIHQTIAGIPLGDPAFYDMLCKADSVGVF